MDQLKMFHTWEKTKDVELRNKLIMSLTNLINSVVNKYGTPCYKKDQKQFAYLWLLEHLSSFDANASSFTSWAIYQVRTAIQTHKYNNQYPIYIPRCKGKEVAKSSYFDNSYMDGEATSNLLDDIESTDRIEKASQYLSESVQQYIYKFFAEDITDIKEYKRMHWAMNKARKIVEGM